MIIKILPIKSKARLAGAIRYISTDKGRIKDYKPQSILHNLLNADIIDIQKEFETNYTTYAKTRSNGNVALHIIQSFSPLDKGKMTPEIMFDLAEALLKTGYEKALAFGVIHSQDNHQHNHFIVSGNEFMSEKSTRLSKSELYHLEKSMLDYMRDNYPELNITYDINNWGKKLNNEKEYYQTKRNPEIRLSKEYLKEKIQNIFRSSESSRHFYKKLKEEGFNTYNYKDSPFGINYGTDGRKIRFSRLGIEIDQIKSLDRQCQRLQELSTVLGSKKSFDLDYDKTRIHDLSFHPTFN